MLNSKKGRFILLATLVLLGIMTRFVPHYPNFTAVGAVALLSGRYFERKFFSYFIPLIFLWFSDIVLNIFVYPEYSAGWQSWIGNTWTYLGIALTIFIGSELVRKVSALNVIQSSILSSLIFFLISNFGVWVNGSMYPAHAGGLIAAYAAGLPYFWSTLLANLIFSLIFFGGYEWLTQRRLLPLRVMSGK